MINSGLMICSFYLKPRFCHGGEERYFLNNKYYSKEDESVFNDVFEMLDVFCKRYYELTDDERSMKMFSVKKETVDIYQGYNYRILTFSIRSGSYGIESDMTDRHTKKIKYRRKADDADIKEFKCMVYVPCDVGNKKVFKGILIFQTISNFGVKSITTQRMKSFFAEFGLTLETRSVSVRAFLEKLVEQGKLYKITLIKNCLSPDASDNIFISAGREERSYINPKLKQTWFEKLLKLFDRTTNVRVYEIEEQQFDDIKVQFKIGDRYRTVGVRYIDRYSVVEDIPDEIFKSEQKKEDLLLDYMIETANIYKDKMVFALEYEG